jgi:hypothetical protein
MTRPSATGIGGLLRRMRNRRVGPPELARKPGAHLGLRDHPARPLRPAATIGHPEHDEAAARVGHRCGGSNEPVLPLVVTREHGLPVKATVFDTVGVQQRP